MKREGNDSLTNVSDEIRVSNIIIIIHPFCWIWFFNLSTPKIQWDWGTCPNTTRKMIDWDGYFGWLRRLKPSQFTIYDGRSTVAESCVPSLFRDGCKNCHAQQIATVIYRREFDFIFCFCCCLRRLFYRRRLEIAAVLTVVIWFINFK